MLSHSKANIHALHGNTVIDYTTNTFPTLVLAEGFFAYEWEKDGKRISNAKGNSFTPNTPGTYRARFSRVASPSASEWNEWSPPLVITSIGTSDEGDNDEDEESEDEENSGEGEDNSGEDEDNSGEDEDNSGEDEDNPGEDQDNPGEEDQDKP